MIIIQIKLIKLKKGVELTLGDIACFVKTHAGFVWVRLLLEIIKVTKQEVQWGSWTTCPPVWFFQSKELQTEPL